MNWNKERTQRVEKTEACGTLTSLVILQFLVFSSPRFFLVLFFYLLLGKVSQKRLTENPRLKTPCPSMTSNMKTP